ncbi:MAG: GNAT family N-acetyltransferase [Thermoplasmata archaeon]|nr:GNAT family N-acetyltransferase [Thermoplasmata archaeon]
MILRDIRPGDYDDLSENYYACYQERAEGVSIGVPLEHEPPPPEIEVAWFQGVLRAAAAGSLLAVVAEEDGHAIGLCTVERAGPSPNSETGHVGVLGILVRRGHRGRGVGRALMEATLERCRGTFEVVRLGVFSTNEGAHRLYLRLGFQDLGTIPKAVKRNGEYIDEKLMVRIL